MMTLANLFDESAAAGTLDTLPERVFPRLHKPTKDVPLDMTFLRGQAEGKDPARAKAAIRLVAMLAQTRLHDSVARPVVERAVLSKDRSIREAATLAMTDVDAARAEKTP